MQMFQRNCTLTLQELLKLRAKRNGAAAVAGGLLAAAAAGEQEDLEWSQVGRKGTAVTTRGDESVQVLARTWQYRPRNGSEVSNPVCRDAAHHEQVNDFGDPLSRRLCEGRPLPLGTLRLEPL